MEKMTVLQPSFRIVYSGRDVTADLSAYVTEVRYTDRLTGQSDELDVTLGDDDGRWLGAWYPDKGAEMSLEYGYAHQRLVSAGGFDVDEVEISARRPCHGSGPCPPASPGRSGPAGARRMRIRP
jgi:phage protein D